MRALNSNGSSFPEVKGTKCILNIKDLSSKDKGLTYTAGNNLIVSGIGYGIDIKRNQAKRHTVDYSSKILHVPQIIIRGSLGGTDLGQDLLAQTCHHVRMLGK